MDVAIVGGGIAGLNFALALHRAGIACRVYEAAPELKELGVGINLLPLAVRELAELDVADAVLARGVETREVCFFTGHGQLVDRDLRGRFGGHAWPQISVHRGELHAVLVEAVRERLGPDAIALGHRCENVRQDADGVMIDFTAAPRAQASIAVGCDGIHSAVRRALHANTGSLRSHGTNQFRGVTLWPPFPHGREYGLRRHVRNRQANRISDQSSAGRARPRAHELGR